MNKKVINFAGAVLIGLGLSTSVSALTTGTPPTLPNLSQSQQDYYTTLSTIVMQYKRVVTVLLKKEGLDEGVKKKLEATLVDLDKLEAKIKSEKPNDSVNTYARESGEVLTSVNAARSNILAIIAAGKIANAPNIVQGVPPQDLKKYQMSYFTAVQGLLRPFAPALEAQNKQKGFDKEAYKKIVQADALLDQINAALKTKSYDSVKAFTDNATTIASNISNLKSQIDSIEGMKAAIPTTFPGKCVAFKGKAGGVKGNIELSGTRKWSFQPLDGSNPSQISPQAGWTDGNPYIPNRGIATVHMENKQVVCIER